MKSVPVPAQPVSRYAPVVGVEPVQRIETLAAAARVRFAGRVIWNISSTAQGGGVAEMLRALLPYVRGAGMDMRWMVLDGSPSFFRLTKRLHHALHGSPGDGSPIDDRAREQYEFVTARESAILTPLMGSRDVVLLHDPQTAGMIPHLVAVGARVIWRCHVGGDTENADVRRGWEFLAPYVSQAHATVFSRAAYIPDCCDHGRSTVIHPCIDPFSPKNQPMEPDVVNAVLLQAGLVAGSAAAAAPVFSREDGSPMRVERRARIHCGGPLPGVWDRMVVQVSRWDPLKDPVGVMHGFARAAGRMGVEGVHLVLAGPDVDAVSDDPEGKAQVAEVVRAWAALPGEVQPRIHAVSLPMDDPDENAAIVNALQRHATVVVQKSLAEGFGLTVTEAMAKGRPILASAVGGIVDQIEDGVSGRLLRDPRDEAAFGDILDEMLSEPEAAEALGARARERAVAEFLGLQSLAQYAALFATVDAG